MTEELKGTVHYSRDDELAILRIDNPPVNPLSSGVRQGLHDGIKQALADAAVQAIVLTGEGRAFIAGADISEFGGQSKGPGLHECLNMMEDSEKIIVAAINGTAFGGGLEVALCADYRVIAPGAPVGLPEVKLGLLPGAGGTQRLPRLTGASKALSVILSGDPIPGPQATELGITDALIEDEDFLAAALAWTRQALADGKGKRLVRDMSERLLADRGNTEIFAEARKQAARKMRGRFSPEMIIQCVQAAVESGDFAAGMKVEAENFRKCLQHPQREALIHIFFSERQVGKVPDISRQTPVQTVAGAGVIGCGTMGGGIAMCFANAGIPVTVLETDQDALERGMGVIRRNYESMVSRGRISNEEAEQRIGLISPTTDYVALQPADLVIEAVYENLDLKKEIFTRLGEVCKADAILASNTSALDIGAMAEASGRPGKVVGMHFFSPANIMRLLEVVRDDKSDVTTVATAMALGKKLGKVAVLAANAPGFIGNRMLAGYTQQAGEMILQGATPYQVDKVMGEFGMPMGPFQMHDLVGLDLGWRARKLANTPPEEIPVTARVADKLCELERFGQKNGRGFYLYSEGSRAGQPDPEVVQLVEETSRELGMERREMNDEEVLNRCLCALVNEGARVLEDGVALRPCDIDIVYINGYGFPEVMGGPMFWADRQGLPHILEQIEKFREEYGDFWTPAPLLEKLVQEGKSFASLQG